MIMENGFNIWVSLLTSVNPSLREYRFTYSDGVVRYLVIEEVKNSPFDYIASLLEDLTEHIDENRILLHNNEFYVYAN